MNNLEWVLSSCLLILAVILVRTLFGKRMRPGLRYALWLPVLFRLLIPGVIACSTWSVLGSVTDLFPNQEIPNSIVTVIGGSNSQVAENDSQLSMSESEQSEPDAAQYDIHYGGIPITVNDLLNVIWLTGAVVTAAILIISNLRFYMALRKRRKLLEIDCPVRVYSVENLSSSCLFRNAIYVTAETAADEAQLRYVIEHELSHNRHGDLFWTFMRCVVLTIHWFNPLVWLAAEMSRQDCELCADAGALKSLGEDKSVEYGSALIQLSVRPTQKSSLLCATTTMNSGKRSLKERITMIAHKPQMTAAVLISVILIIVIAIGAALLNSDERNHFPMSGNNISDLDTDLILSKISEAKKLKDTSEIWTVTDFGIDVIITPDFNWDSINSIAFYYNKNQKTYRSRLNIDSDNNEYRISIYDDLMFEQPIYEGFQLSEYEKVYKLRDYLNALKYLPQEEIQKLAPDLSPNECYYISKAGDWMPDDNKQTITYNQYRKTEQLDNWKIHLIASPHHYGYDEIHLFYVE